MDRQAATSLLLRTSCREAVAMEVVRTSETPVFLYESARRYIPEGCPLHNVFHLQKNNWLMLFREIIAVYSENHMKLISRLQYLG
jgi:hypothetical protein